MGNRKARRMRAIDVWTNRETGEKLYAAPGHRPDNAVTLDRAGLIRCDFDAPGDRVATVLLKPDDMRVIAWQLTINDACRRRGMAPAFDDIGVVRDEPQERA